MDTDRAEFLAGARPEDVLIYFAEMAVDDPDQVAEHAESVPGGLVLTLSGERGRGVFQRATGTDPMAFAQKASAREGVVDRALTGGQCPDADPDGDEGATDEDHPVRFLFSFAEEQKDDVEGIYTEGDVIHAYVQCDCGVAYSEKWVVGDTDE